MHYKGIYPAHGHHKLFFYTDIAFSILLIKGLELILSCFYNIVMMCWACMCHIYLIWFRFTLQKAYGQLLSDVCRGKLYMLATSIFSSMEGYKPSLTELLSADGMLCALQYNCVYPGWGGLLTDCDCRKEASSIKSRC